MTMPATMSEAKATGAQYYFTGKPCKNGHVEKRYATGSCMGCLRDISRRRYEKNPEYQKMWAKENPDKRRRAVATWRIRNLEKDMEARRAFKKSNPKKQTHDAAMARARKLGAVPPWVDTASIRAIYDACPPGFEVDHIVPLRHERACGLHVPWNLQYLTKVENRAKNKRANLEEIQ